MSVLKADFRLKRPGFMMDIRCEIDSKIMGIFGPSGAGKTTLLHVIAGLEKPDEGSISILNREVYNNDRKIDIPPDQRKVGYVFQDSLLFPHLNVVHNLKYGQKKKPDMKFFMQIVDLLGIGNLLDKNVSQISGGQAQRVAIGRALLSSPDILVLDEPFSSLDKDLRWRIISMLKPLIEKFKIPMLVVSHDLSDLLLLSDQLMVIRDGKCMGYGNYYDLLSKSEAFREMNKSGIINSLQLKLSYIDGEKGIMILRQNGHQVVAESILDESAFFDDPNVTVYLKPEDITLALHKIRDISIQNQLEGRIERLIYTEKKVLCVIDHGFKLISEVTHAACQDLKLEEGKKIWCLFKAAAVKTNLSFNALSAEY